MSSSANISSSSSSSARQKDGEQGTREAAAPSPVLESIPSSSSLHTTSLQGDDEESVSNKQERVGRGKGQSRLPPALRGNGRRPSDLLEEEEEDDEAASSDEDDSAMGALKDPFQASSSQMDRSGYLSDDNDEHNYSHGNTSPPKRNSRLNTALSKLHLRHSSGQSKRDGGFGEGRRASDDHGGLLSSSSRPSMDVGYVSDGGGGKKGGSKLSSGKHTPLKKDATGDFAEFLQAEELKAALAEEQEKEIKRELKAAKHPNKRGKEGGALGGKGKIQSPDEKLREARDEEDRKHAAMYTPEGPTLEERGYFPGDLRHHGHLNTSSRQQISPQKTTGNVSPRKPSFSSQKRIKPPGICGPVSDSDDSSSDFTDEEEEGLGGKKVNVDNDSTSSSLSSDILDQVVNPSIRSLKSWQSEGSGGQGSLASGGANVKLTKPLLQLEELELDSFLKNFGRHTREIRVPSSANFPRKRMPQWEDFKVPPGEAALAAAQGKRVTVLTHVDRGLQMLAASEGQGMAPPPRPVPELGKEDGKDKKKRKKESSSGKDKKGNDGGSASSSTPRVSWAPDAGKSAKSQQQQQQQQQGQQQQQNRPPSPEMTLANLNKRSLELDEKEAKRQEREANNGGSGGGGGIINIHQAEREWRPSRDEANMEDDDWELLHHAEGLEVGEDEVQVPEDEKVDGVAWAIAYILAMVERYAPEELDNSPDQTYREGKTRSHIERLYLIAPFWERLLLGIRRVYRWDNPSRTSSFMMAYFTLWYMNLIPTAFFCMLIYYICQFRFFPPSASYLHEQVRARMARGVDADRLAERLRRRSRLDILEIYKRFVIAYGSGSQLACGDVADFHEKVKNLILWRNPTATWRTLTHMSVTTVLVTFLPSWLIWKIIFFFLGFTFFILLPLQSHYPRFRRPLSPIWWALWGSPTDAQFAIQLLRRRHLERQHAKHPPVAGLDLSDDDLDAKDRAAMDAAIKRSGSSHSGTGGGNGLKNRLRRSSAARAIAYGSMRPLTESEGGLLDLRDTKVLNGQITSKPRKLGSFFCQHHGVPGHLHVNTRMLYFVALHSHVNKEGKGRKTCKTMLEDISGLVKTKSIKLFVWSSSGLQVIRKEKGSLFFSNMPHRDNAFNLLLAVGSEVWNKV